MSRCTGNNKKNLTSTFFCRLTQTRESRDDMSPVIAELTLSDYLYCSKWTSPSMSDAFIAQSGLVYL